MSEEKKNPDPPEWQNNKSVNFNGLRELLVVVKDRLESAIEAEKKELTKHVRAMESLRTK